MVYIFSNIYKFESRDEYVQALDAVGFNARDVFVFLNTSEPFFRASEYFIEKVSGDEGKIVFFQRKAIKCRRKEDGRHYGEKRVTRFLSENPIYKSKCEMLFTSRKLYVVGIEGTLCRIDRIGYPKHMNPTTGFIAARYFCERNGIDNVVLVNFLGTKDDSTPHASLHDWKYEEIELSAFRHVCIFPSGKRC